MRIGIEVQCSSFGRNKYLMMANEPKHVVYTGVSEVMVKILRLKTTH
jgi:hypothetical protein